VAEVAAKAISLLDEFKRGTAFEAALVSTYNVYFPFLEELVLRRLRSLGCSYVVALADAGQVASEVGEPTRRPKLAGRRYALLPVSAPGAFHPKIALFLGPRSARVLVGSHNLTMSGFGLNREMTNVIEVQGKKDREGAAAVQEVLGFARDWTAKLAPALVKSLEDLAGFAEPYRGPIPTDRTVTVVGARPEGETLWERVLPSLPGSADRITVVGPFYGQQLDFLNRVCADLSPDELVVGLDPETVSFPSGANLPSVSRIVDASSLCPGKNADGYLHAKAILIESGGSRVLLSGSANPTFSAWLAGPTSRNAEIVVVRRLAPEDDDLGLSQLTEASVVSPPSITTSSYHEPSSPSEEGARLLLGVASSDSITVGSPPSDVREVRVLSSDGETLASKFEVSPDKIAIRLSRLEEAALFQVRTGDDLYEGWVHHVDALHQMALPSSQRRIRDALGGLGGDPSQLEQLLKMVEKVVFHGPAAEGHGRSGAKPKEKQEDEPEPTTKVVFVPTLRGDGGEALRRLSSGDLGLLLDVLMRQLWRSLTHEESISTRSEGELVDSEDEDLVEELPTDPRVAELWRKKTATLLRRLMRRLNEATDTVQVVIECAAVLGVLEAVRRVEEHDRWRTIRATFLDRGLAAKFFLEAAPEILRPDDGLLDSASAEVEGVFAEQEALLRWLVWLAWTVGFGPSELLRGLDDAEDPARAVRALATVGLLAARLGGSDGVDTRVLELLEATPRRGVRPDEWIADLMSLGVALANPAAATRVQRAPKPGDLAILSIPDKPPLWVIAVRGNKLELLDFSKPDSKLVMLAGRVSVVAPYSIAPATRSA
jgi:hypothetical protein